MRTTSSHTKSVRLLAAFSVLAVGLLAACGTQAKDSGGTGGSTALSGPTIEELTSKGTEQQPPASGPAAQSGKTVIWVSCGLAAPECSVPSETAKEAAAKLGIKYRVIDGKLNAAGGFVTSLQTAIAQRPDGIIVHGMNCELLKAPLAEAKKLGIKTLAAETPDCSTSGFTADMNYAPSIENSVDQFKIWGTAAAEYLVAKTKGLAKVIVSSGSDEVFPPIQEGFMEVMNKCSTCKVVDTVDFAAADQIPDGPWLQRLRASLVRHPDANAVFIPSDFMSVSLGGAKAANEANPKLMVIDGGPGTVPGIQAVRSGSVTAIGAAHDGRWLGYAAMDDMNRLLAGEKTVSQGVGARSIDEDHNLPDATDSPYVSPIDWKSAYESLWNK
jgi:ribose transport system substrate-binding protein